MQPLAGSLVPYGHTERVFDLQFSPVSSLLIASASEDTTVRFWEQTAAGARFRQVLCCKGHDAEVLRVGWSLDGTLLASGSADNTVRVWRGPVPGQSPSYQGEQLALLQGHPEEVYHVEFLTPGEGASPAVPAAQVSHSTHGAHSMHGVESAHSSLTSSLQPALASLGIEPLTQRPASLLNAQSHAPHAAHAGPGSHILAASGESLFLWDLEEGVLQQQADAPGTSGSTVPADAVTNGYRHAYIFAACRQPACGPAGGVLLACACSDGVIRVWAATQGELVFVGSQVITTGGGAQSLTCATFDSMGNRLAVGVKDGALHILDVRQGFKAVRSWRAPTFTLTCCSLPPGSTVGAQVLAHAAHVAHAAEQQELLLVGGADGCIRLYSWDEPGLEVVLPPPPHAGPASQRLPVLALSASRSGCSFAAAGEPVKQLARALEPEVAGRQQAESGLQGGNCVLGPGLLGVLPVIPAPVAKSDDQGGAGSLQIEASAPQQAAVQRRRPAHRAEAKQPGGMGLLDAAVEQESRQKGGEGMQGGGQVGEEGVSGNGGNRASGVGTGLEPLGEHQAQGKASNLDVVGGEGSKAGSVGMAAGEGSAKPPHAGHKESKPLDMQFRAPIWVWQAEACV